jgi:hypothetical protein
MSNGSAGQAVAPGGQRGQVADAAGQGGRERDDDVAGGDLAAFVGDPDAVGVLGDGADHGAQADPVTELGGHPLRDLVGAADDAGFLRAAGGGDQAGQAVA